MLAILFYVHGQLLVIWWFLTHPGWFYLIATAAMFLLVEMTIFILVCGTLV
jgi:hypothetical protein